MKQLLTVFRFTYDDEVKKKSFVITTVIVMVLVLAACVVARILTADDGEIETVVSQSVNLYYLDEENHIPDAEAALARFGFTPARISAEEVEAIKEKISDDGDINLVEVKGGDVPEIVVYMKNFMESPDTAGIKEALTQAWRAGRLAETGLEQAEIDVLMQPLMLSTQAVSSINPLSYALGLVFAMFMFFAVYIYGVSVASSVSMEKTSRVMETLVISARPRNILLGKVLGTGAAGLTQLLAIIAAGLLGVKVLLPKGGVVAVLMESMRGMATGTALMLIAYFILGFLIYALLSAVCGASVSRIEDVSNAMMPISIMGVASFYLGYMSGITGGGSGAIEMLARYLPSASPFGMPMRYLAGQVSMTEVLISLGIMAATIIALSGICVKLYERSVMYYGKRLKLKDMLKLKV